MVLIEIESGREIEIKTESAVGIDFVITVEVGVDIEIAAAV